MSSSKIETIDEFVMLDMSEVVADSCAGLAALPSDSIARIFGTGPRVPTTPDHRWGDDMTGPPYRTKR